MDAPEVLNGPGAAPAVDEDRLYHRAILYLGRYASTRAQLRRVLVRRLIKEGAQPGDEGAMKGAVERVIARVAQEGWLDDRQYAERKVDQLWRGGRSLAQIGGMLAAKGVSREDREHALEALCQSREAPDLEAATALARRRGLGPWRATADRSLFRQKDLARLARAGFGREIAVRIVDASDPAELQQDE